MTKDQEEIERAKFEEWMNSPSMIGRNKDGCYFSKAAGNSWLGWLARAELDAKPQGMPDADVWIAWEGGECPLKDGVRHELKFRDGSTSGESDEASLWFWRNSGYSGDIIAYRVIE